VSVARRSATSPSAALLPPTAARFLRAVGFVLLLAGPACGSGDAPHEVRLRGEALGTEWSVALVVRTLLAEERVADLRSRVAGTLDRIDRGMSTWRDDAELVRFNRSAGTRPFRFSPETRRVVAAALDLARETGGAFDPTVEPLMPLWGFRGEPTDADPGEAELERARARVGWRKLVWDDEGRLVKRVAGVELDLSAIAKGYAVDAIVDDLARERPLGLLVEVGGEVRALGTKAGGEPWRVGIEDARLPGANLEAVVELTGGALATSGDYRQARIVDGERRGHVLDPRTGRPAQTGVASASVVAPTCMEADAVATALMVLGADAALAWVEARPWLEALLLIREGDRIVERRASSGWADRRGPAR
jgi:thiamine biosynthesis lipoprotein